MGVVAKMPATAHIPVVFVFHPFLCQTDTTPAWAEVGNRWRSVTTTAHTLPRKSRIADALEDHRPLYFSASWSHSWAQQHAARRVSTGVGHIMTVRRRSPTLPPVP
ncbi:hypothetical protein BD311DRAFT_767300 [Dichomitus squalens]|uniref:Uncharacterized protein n=1 Tax=Dichomitus squalens TaxID=114155 RepID=A0A4Q9MC03_9APHY|nr:hypothetical protein BD311DRAFT_767300 [Dichomitus squalens]